MKIINLGRGIHEREVPGIEKLQPRLPDAWRGFTNLELALPGGGREIDLIVIAEDRILVVDLKDWRGTIESAGGAWKLNGKEMDGGSPVEKVLSNTREIRIKLTKYLKDQSTRGGRTGNQIPTPKVQGFVVLTGTEDKAGIAPTESDAVYSVDFFIKMLKNKGTRIATIGGVAPDFHAPVLLEQEWTVMLMRFFNTRTGPFDVSTRRYGSYKATSNEATFAHSAGIFSEFDVEDRNAGAATGLLRRWDFTKADVRFQTEAGRREIAGRERAVIAWLNDRNPSCESGILQPRVDDPEKGVGYWEVFDRRRRLRRLSDFSSVSIDETPPDTRVELVRQLLVQVKALHDLDAAHLDIGAHSVWLESPSIVRMSHLMTASFPQRETLGSQRFQFLSTVVVPEDMLNDGSDGKRKDVFLLGCAAHQIVFGKAPGSATTGQPCEWSPDIDAGNRWSEFHPWFVQALDWDPKSRFKNAASMLEAFNSILARTPSPKQVVEGLERFKTLQSQRQLLKEYPEKEDVRDDDLVAMWTTEVKGELLLVKMWKRASWGDQSKEASRILEFLEKAESVVRDPLPGCVKIKRVIWLGDAIVIVQQHLAGQNLRVAMLDAPAVWQKKHVALGFIGGLCEIVGLLHDRQFSHGDLKPENIVIERNNPELPMLVDLVDFSPIGDGEMRSTAYAPAVGGRFERDRYAVTKMAEEILVQADVAESAKAALSAAIHLVRHGPPENGTLLPLIEAVRAAAAPESPPVQMIELVLAGASQGSAFLCDEGYVGLRRSQAGQLVLRGACEQLYFNVDKQGHIAAGWRVPLEQKRIAAVQRHEFTKLPAQIKIRSGAVSDFKEVELLLATTYVAALWRKACDGPNDRVELRVEDADDDHEDAVDSDSTADAVEEAIVEETEPENPIDVPGLWNRLIQVEKDLKIEGVALAASSYHKRSRRHVLPFQLEAGVFDFSKDDTVLVSRMERSGRWARIGNLDIHASGSDRVAIDVTRWLTRDSEELIHEGQRLQFSSHYEYTSRSRREAATQRVLARRSTIRNLIDIFDSKCAVKPETLAVQLDREAIEQRYSLNVVQSAAFADLINIRPVGLLQGPPGTGKTRFIGALVHFALTNGLAKNVLLASQSHEAVNGAAEAVMKLFRSGPSTPSILRVGHESDVSEALLPYHVDRVELFIKDRFKAEHRERLRDVASTLGLSQELAEKIVFIDTVIAPVMERYRQLTDSNDEDVKQRSEGLRETLNTLLIKLASELREESLGEDYGRELAMIVAAAHGERNATKVAKFREVTQLGRDFVGSVATRRRNFEAFLAGTRQVVAGTCVGLGRSSLGLTETAFDLVVIDEAARCTAGELAVPIQAGRWVVLVGDHFQLEPHHRPQVVTTVAAEQKIPRREVVRSDFERVFLSSYGQIASRTLTTQYRMLPAIGELASGAFYGKRLNHARIEPIIPADAMPDFFASPLTWLTTDGFGEAGFQREIEGRRGALENPAEAELVVELLRLLDSSDELRRWLETQRQFDKAIGVICTYRAQSDLIRTKLRNSFLTDSMRDTLKIDTVDSYQGKENPIVILSLVRNNNDGAAIGTERMILEGFMARANRLNVAVTRAMDFLCIVGAATRWRPDGPMGSVVREFDEQVSIGSARYMEGARFRGTRDLGKQTSGKRRMADRDGESQERKHGI